MASSILNSDDGVISGVAGIKATGGDDGVLVFQSKGTETARINTDKQIVAAAGTASLPIYSTTGDLNTGIYFPAADNIGFATNGVIRGRWTTDGLCFGSDTAAANALDDYEEGTWTPTIEGSITAGTASYTVQSMAYVKIGNAVFINGYVTWSGATGTGNLRLAGLPFTANATYYSHFTFGLNDIAMTAGRYGLLAQTVLNNTKINFYQGPTGGGSLSSVPMDSAGDIYIGGVYFI